MPTLAEVYQSAVNSHQTGDLKQAEQLYRAVLQHDPKNADAWNGMGVLHHQLGKNEEALGFMRQAIQR